MEKTKNVLQKFKDEELEKVAGGNETEFPLYSVGQKVCVFSSIIAEIITPAEKGPLDTDYLYKSTVTGYTQNCSEHTKNAFPIGQSYYFYENDVTSVIQ